MAKLILRRLHQWPDIRQSYEIHLDGTPVASIGSGKTVEIEVARSPRDHGDDGPVLEQPTGPTRHRPGRGSSRRGRDVLEESPSARDRPRLDGLALPGHDRRARGPIRKPGGPLLLARGPFPRHAPAGPLAPCREGRVCHALAGPLSLHQADRPGGFNGPQPVPARVGDPA